MPQYRPFAWLSRACVRAFLCSVSSHSLYYHVAIGRGQYLRSGEQTARSWYETRFVSPRYTSYQRLHISTRELLPLQYATPKIVFAMISIILLPPLASCQGKRAFYRSNCLEHFAHLQRDIYSHTAHLPLRPCTIWRSTSVGLKSLFQTDLRMGSNIGDRHYFVSEFI